MAPSTRYEKMSKAHVKLCYYKILGVTHRAGREEIKKAFRLLALRWHPDRNPHDPEAGSHFRALLEAYETLVDPSTRGRYDRGMGYRKPEERSRHGSRRHDYDIEDEKGAASSLDELLRECFGISGRVPHTPPTYDLRFDLQVIRGEIIRGRHEAIRYERLVLCPRCRGGPRMPGRAGRETCSECMGSGEVEEVCSLDVWIPAGSPDGTRLRIPGAGDRFRDTGQVGDLVVVLHVVDV